MRCKRGTVKNRKTGLCEPRTAKVKTGRRNSPSPTASVSPHSPQITTIKLRFPATEKGTYNKLIKDYAVDADYIYPMLLAIAQFHYAPLPAIASAQERFFNKVLAESANPLTKLHGILYNMRIKANGGVPTFPDTATESQIVSTFLEDTELNRAYIAPMLKNIAKGKVSQVPLVASAQKQFLQDIIELGPQYSAISNRIYKDIAHGHGHGHEHGK